MSSNAMPFQVMLLACIIAAVAAQSKPGGCNRSCGHLNIPYPFGTSEGCYRDETFLITCNTTSGRANLTRSNIEVLNISLSGELRVLTRISKQCYDSYGHLQLNESENRFLRLQNFSLSSTKNKFTVVGCDTRAYIEAYSGDKFITGCSLVCENITDVINGSCSGIGCCQTNFPKSNDGYQISLFSFYNHTDVYGFNPCSYAFVVEDKSFTFYSQDLKNLGGKTRFPLVLNWAIGNETCAKAKKSTSGDECKENSDCMDSDNRHGYFCKCKPGFEGNPYLSGSDGCKDIDECSKKKPCHSTGICFNTPGSYNCSCPPGYKGNGYKNGTGCSFGHAYNKLLIIEIALGISIAWLVLVLLISSLCWVHKQRTITKLRRKFFEQNGGMMLRERLSEGVKTKIFTEAELEKATDNFHNDRILGHGGQGTVYKGIFSDNTPVAIKKSRIADQKQVKDFINELVVLSQINHRNVVRILGCCLETEVPLLVYEFVPNGTLLDHLDADKNASSLPWETRLRIAAETAGAIAYLHSAASIPIIHRDIKSSNILLDHNHTSKVSDFGVSRLVPIDQTQFTTLVQGTLGYLDPEYLHTGQLNEKSDVYSFGVVLVELLTGKKAVEFSRPEEERNLAMHFVNLMKEDRLLEVLDNRMLDKENIKQIKEVASLVRMCVRVNGEERPIMREVAMELEGLIAVEKHPWKKGDLMMPEEKEYLLGHVSDAYYSAGASNSAGYDSTQNQMAFEIEDGR